MCGCLELVYSNKCQVIFTCTCIGLYFECTNNAQFQLPDSVCILFHADSLVFNPLTPASNCLRPTPNFRAFFGIFQSERKHKNKLYAQ